MRMPGVLMVLILLCLGSAADELPDSPSAIVSSSLVGARPQPIVSQRLLKEQIEPGRSPHTSDRKFVLLSGLAMGLTIADFEMTQRCLAQRSCAEANPLMPASRAGMYASNVPLNMALLYWSYRRKAAGKRFWWVPPLMIIGSHAAGVGTNIAIRR